MWIAITTCDGIEAARRIRKLSPGSKILFISQESSADVIEEAFNSGAMGYITKTHASELLAAVEPVCQARQYVNGNGSRHDLKQPRLSDHAPLSERTQPLK
jgi:DNA-binding NarL/FixJ family response regulator